MAELQFDPVYPIRVSAAGQDHHPTGVETTRNLTVAVWERDGEMWRTYSLNKGLTWATPSKFANQTPIFHPRAHMNDRGGFALVWGNPSSARDVWFEEINEVMNISEHLIGVNIQRTYGTTAKGGQVSIANPRRIYDPEVVGSEWTGIMYPGAHVEILLGYGGDNKMRFSGYIDDVESEDLAGFMVLSLRGDLKYLLDQNIKRKLSYTDKVRTTHIVEMAVEAGIDPNKIQVQPHTQTFTEEFDRERTYAEIISSHIDELGYEMIEPDEGGLIARSPIITAAPVWFYEEEKNMYTRTRSWDDDDVTATVMAYREEVRSEDGTTIKFPELTYEEAVDSPFLMPPRKTFFVQLGNRATLATAQTRAHRWTQIIARQGSTVQIITPLNVALEIGDTVFIRRKSWSQSGTYLVEALDDDCKKNLGQSRELAGTSRGGQFKAGQGGGGGFANVVTGRKLNL